MRVAAAAAFALLLVTPAYTQESESAAEAARLTQLLQAQGLDAVAARHPEQSDRYIAALHFPGAQLLVISAAYPAPAAMDARISERRYKDAYIDLQSAGVNDGRFFVMDLQADGLRRSRERNEPFDITYTNGVEQMSYDGTWADQKMSEAEYNARFEQEDRRYAAMLAALTSALQAPASGPDRNR
jgi:hypothetical protein